jgi:hypothetical protein
LAGDLTEKDFFADLRVRHAARDQAQDLAFAVGEPP